MKITSLMAVAVLGISSLYAQQADAPKPANTATSRPETTKQAAKPTVYRFEYTLTELSGKQKINVRKFEVLTSDRGNVLASTRVPVPTTGFGTPGPPGVAIQYQFMELALNANMHFTTGGDGVIHLDVEVSMNFIVAPEHPPSGADALPAGSRLIKMQIATEVKPGVPTSIGTVEDVASTHAYELSVTATPR